jgi:hypothetical protein
VKPETSSSCRRIRSGTYATVALPIMHKRLAVQRETKAATTVHTVI